MKSKTTITTPFPLEVGGIYFLGGSGKLSTVRVIERIDAVTYRVRPIRFHEQLWLIWQSLLRKLER